MARLPDAVIKDLRNIPSAGGNTPSALPPVWGCLEKNFPEELKDNQRWVLWTTFKNKVNPKKVSKAPCTVSGAFARWAEVADLLPFNVALKRLKSSKKARGLGYVFKENEEDSTGCVVCCIDIDDHQGVKDINSLISEAKPFFPSYTEYSQSGRGLHVFFKAKADKIPEGLTLSCQGERDLFIHNGFVAMTGNLLAEAEPKLEDRTEAFLQWLKKYKSGVLEKKQGNLLQYTDRSALTPAPPSSPASYPVVTSTQLQEWLEKHPSSKELFFTKPQEGISNSEGDIALCNSLCWLTRDPRQVEGLMRQSLRVRPQWDKPCKGGSFLQVYLVANALRWTQEAKVPFENLPKEEQEKITSAILSQFSTEDEDADTAREHFNKALNSKSNFEEYIFKQSFILGRPALRELISNVKHMRKFPDVWLKQVEKDCFGEPDQAVIASLVRKDHLLLHRGEIGFYEFKGGVWKATDDAIIKGYIDKVLRKRMSQRRTDAVLDKLKTDCHKEIEFNKKPLLTFENGTYELETGHFREARPEDYCTIKLAFNYDPTARAERWENFIDEIMLGDEAKALLLQQASGYILFSDCRLQKCFVLLGRGANGKSVFLNTLRAVFGDENSTKLEMGAFSEPFKLILLYSSIVNFATENNSRIKGAEETFKLAVAGDPLLACQKGKPFIQFTPRAKYFFACNEFMRPADRTEGFLRRFIFIKFNAHFVANPKGAGDFKADRELEAKLRLELSGIFNWILQGYESLKSSGEFLETQEHKETLEEFRQSYDVVAEFINEEIVQRKFWEKCNWRSREDFYDMFKNWCLFSGHERTLTRANFTRQFKQRLIDLRLFGGESKNNGSRVIYIKTPNI